MGKPAKDLDCVFEGLILPLFGSTSTAADGTTLYGGEHEWPNVIRVILYLMGLCWIFLGVAVISDVFMAGIEKITSAKRRIEVGTGDQKRKKTVYIWNPTVANLTLMALGSSAPEILLSLIEISSDEFFLGPLGAGTIVGSAAFNLLCISAVCVAALDDGDSRKIKEVHVYMITASVSVFAYLWLMFILMISSPDVCEIWEAVVTLLMCPALVFAAFLADKGYCKKGGDEEELLDDHGCPVKTFQKNKCDTIADEPTDQELLDIAEKIRKEHGNDISNKQIALLMKHEYLQKRSRAHYRHAAMEHALHGKSELKTTPGVSEIMSTSDDVEDAKKSQTCIIGFESCSYAYKENIGKAKIALVRYGALNCKAKVHVETQGDTAEVDKDFQPVNTDVVFEKDVERIEVEIPIIDDDENEHDEQFYVNLSNAAPQDSPGFFAKINSKYNKCTITILDDDKPGILRFEKEEVTFDEKTGDEVLEVCVQRKQGVKGEVSCSYVAESMKAVEGVDFEAASGKLKFESGQGEARIKLTIKGRRRSADADLQIVVQDAEGGATFDPETEPLKDVEKCICHIMIKAGGQTDMLDRMKSRINSANAIMGHKNWAQQFHDALFDLGGDDDEDEDEDGGEGEKGEQKVDKFTLFIHIASVPWKLLFAFVPPVDYCGGWLCFFCALVMIAGVTALVGDMANLVGCTLGMLPENAAITFVALGTSLPDTFASMTAAKVDPSADASIGNVTGSNSVNVFLGVGIAWAMAAFKWNLAEPTVEWSKRILKQEPDVIKNVGEFLAGSKNAVFVTPAGTLWFNLMVFCLNATCALLILYARRRYHGGELGGPKKGFLGQYMSAAFLAFQWFIYVGASMVFARVNDGVTYTKLASD